MHMSFKYTASCDTYFNSFFIRFNISCVFTLIIHGSNNFNWSTQGILHMKSDIPVFMQSATLVVFGGGNTISALQLWCTNCINLQMVSYNYFHIAFSYLGVRHSITGVIIIKTAICDKNSKLRLRFRHATYLQSNMTSGRFPVDSPHKR